MLKAYPLKLSSKIGVGGSFGEQTHLVWETNKPFNLTLLVLMIADWIMLNVLKVE